MPKVKLGEPDPRQVEVKAMIAAGKSKQGMTNDQLAKRIGENTRTMEDHLRHFERMRFTELWSILDALKVPAEDRAKLL